MSALLAVSAAIVGVAGAWELVRLFEAAWRDGTVSRLLGATDPDALPSDSERRQLVAVVCVTFSICGLMLGGVWLAALAAGSGPLAVRTVASGRQRRYRRQVASGMPTAARAIADALSGGHAITGAIAEAARSTEGAAGRELAAVAHRIGLGEPAEAAIQTMRARIADPSWGAMASAILLQREVGGDLASLLRSLAATTEDGRRAEAGARASLAQARATAQLIGGVPLLAVVGLMAFSPGTLTRSASNSAALMLLIVSALLGAVGVVLLTALARSVARV